MMSIFWDFRGVIHVDYADRNVKINGDYYAQLVETARKKRRKPHGQALFLSHDNAPIHKSAVADFSVKKSGFNVLDQPAYSPDLVPSDFYLFGHLKIYLKGKRFDDKDQLTSEVQIFLNNQPPEW